MQLDKNYEIQNYTQVKVARVIPESLLSRIKSSIAEKQHCRKTWIAENNI